MHIKMELILFFLCFLFCALFLDLRLLVEVKETRNWFYAQGSFVTLKSLLI